MSDLTTTLWVLRLRASGVYELWQQGDLVSEADWLNSFDSALDAIQNQNNLILTTGSGTATTLTAQALSGQKNLSVASTAELTIGDSIYIGVGDAAEAHVVDTIPSAVLVTTVANLATTFASGQPVTKSPVEIVDARNGYATLPARLNSMLPLDVKAYGAKGDGTTDDTTAIQAALDALQSASVSGLYFPPGTYKITAALTIPFLQQKDILGAGREITIIKQFTNNVAIFQTAFENTHSIDFGGMTLDYNTQQTSANTGSYGLLFTKAGGAGVGSGWYYWTVRDLVISKAHIAIGIGGPSGTGALPVWNCLFEDIRTFGITNNVIKFRSPTSQGMPVNTFRQLSNVGGGQVNIGAAIDLGVSEAVFIGLDIEDWYGRVLYADGGRGTVVSGCHIERHHLSTTNAMFEIADGSLVIDGLNLNGEVTGGVAARILQAGSQGSVLVRGVYANFVLTSGTIVGITAANNSRSINISGVLDEAGNVSWGLPAGYVGTRAVGNAAGNTVAVANQYYFTEFSVPSTRRITQARFEVATSVGDFDVAIFDHFGNRLANTFIPVPAVGLRTAALNVGVTLNPGKKYYVGLVFSGAAAFAYRASSSAAHAAAAGIASDQVGAAPPFPTTVTITATGGGRQYAVDFI